MINEEWLKERRRMGGPFLAGTGRDELLRELLELYSEYKLVKEQRDIFRRKYRRLKHLLNR